jgi:hypothetical protein
MAMNLLVIGMEQWKILDLITILILKYEIFWNNYFYICFCLIVLGIFGQKIMKFFILQYTKELFIK